MPKEKVIEKKCKVLKDGIEIKRNHQFTASCDKNGTKVEFHEDVQQFDDMGLPLTGDIPLIHEGQKAWDKRKEIFGEE